MSFYTLNSFYSFTIYNTNQLPKVDDIATSTVFLSKNLQVLERSSENKDMSLYRIFKKREFSYS
jgi:hypothetical protein